jgi:uncharacterized repeat protein (TIGR01451 family)
MKTRHLSITFLLLTLLLLGSPPANAVGTTTRVSVATGGTEAVNYGPYGSEQPALSADGRYIAFQSYAPNLVAGDTNEVTDVFLHDRQTGQTSRVSVASDGTEAHGDMHTLAWADSGEPALSADGRFVAFWSEAINLVAGDTNERADVFVHDRQTGETSRVSVAAGGAEANGGSGPPVLSADGNFVAFGSYATNLVAGDTNGKSDIFVHDRLTSETSRVSIATGGMEANGDVFGFAISANGRFVAFSSSATNLVVGDTNGDPDVFVHDRQTGETTRVSVATDGTEADDDDRDKGGSRGPTLSADGRYVAFESSASNLVAGDRTLSWIIFVHDRQTGETSRVNLPTTPVWYYDNGWAFHPSLSADGRYVAFESYSTNLVAGDTNRMVDIFVHDRQTGVTSRVSVAPGGAEAAGDISKGSSHPALSADGRFVAFDSTATNLVAGDTNGGDFGNDGGKDVFVRDRLLNKKAFADLTLAGKDTPDPAQRGNTLTYTFTLKNQGPDRATGATLVNVLPSELILNSATSSQGSCNQAGVLVCRLGTLAIGKRATVTVNATVSPGAPSTIWNTATAQASPRDHKPNNNRKVLKTTVSP